MTGEEKQSILSKIFGKQKSSCCNVQIEEVTEEKKEEKKKETGDNIQSWQPSSCCGRHPAGKA